MYLVELHGQGTSRWPGASGAPTLWTALTKPPRSSMRRSARSPIRVMIRMDTATYGESVISTPTWEISLPSGPMQNGTTYIVRPRMQPLNSLPNVSRISAGAIQLLVGPASSSRSEQLNVRSATRATSLGSEAAWKLLGRLARRVNVPCSTRRLVRRTHSSSEPSHHSIRSGWVRAAICLTHETNSALLVGAGTSTVTDTSAAPPLTQGSLIINDGDAGMPIGLDLLVSGVAAGCGHDDWSTLPTA